MAALILSSPSAPPQYEDMLESHTLLAKQLWESANESPEKYVDTLAEYLKDPQTHVRVAKEARKGLRDIRQIRLAFPMVARTLRDFDAVSAEGRSGQLFAPEWEGYHHRFEVNLMATEELGKTAKNAVDSYIETILPLFENPNFTMEDKERKIKDFLQNIVSLNLTVQTIESLVLEYVNLNDKINVFRAAFIQIMEREGQTLSSEHSRLRSEISDLNDQLRNWAPFRNVLEASNPFGAFGMFSPVVASILGTGIVKGGNSAEELLGAIQSLEAEIANKERLLRTSTASGDQYEALRLHLDYASSEMHVIISLLKSVGLLLKELHDSALKAKLHLQNAANGKSELLVKLSLKLSTQSFATLQSFLNAFISRWKDEVSWERYTGQLRQYFKDPLTQETVAEQGRNAGKILHSIEGSFVRVAQLLSEFEQVRRIGLPWQPLPMDWRSPSNGFSATLKAVYGLQRLAHAVVESYMDMILPLVNNTSVGSEEKLSKIEEFLREVALFDLTTGEMVDNIVRLRDDVRVFRMTLDETRQREGPILANDVHDSLTKTESELESIIAQLESLCAILHRTRCDAKAAEIFLSDAAKGRASVLTKIMLQKSANSFATLQVFWDAFTAES